MQRFVHVTVGASAAGETLVDALAGLGERKRTIKSIRYARYSGSASGSAFGESKITRIRAYRNQEQVVDFPLTSFDWGIFSGTQYVERADPLLVDIELSNSDGFKIGFFNGSVAPVGDLVIAFTES